jgi:hypothetical protein
VKVVNFFLKSLILIVIEIVRNPQSSHNKTLHLTATSLRSLAAGELGRYGVNCKSLKKEI